ncbi:hypothetical protein [Prevotella sp.]|uniref:hypothetical protein n=1 Tax=Prevotella sp. TaxID=59823 RepID=UPI0025D775D9|nr:hypothetical protein [Prevotella sp.]
MKKKKYVAPEVSVIEMEPLQIMAGSVVSDRGWTPDGDKNNGFSVKEEEENGEYEF